jgi:hypothetical protein
LREAVTGSSLDIEQEKTTLPVARPGRVSYVFLSTAESTQATDEDSQMKVSLCFVHDGVMVMPLDEAARAAMGTGMVKVQAGETFAGMPYASLRALGDGDHELNGQAIRPGTPIFQQETVVNAGPVLDGWTSMGLTVVFCVLAVVVFFLFSWMEEGGGSMRIHWALALAYNFGGKWGAAGLCVGLAGLFFFKGLGNFGSQLRQ